MVSILQVLEKKWLNIKQKYITIDFSFVSPETKFIYTLLWNMFYALLYFLLNCGYFLLGLMGI